MDARPLKLVLLLAAVAFAAAGCTSADRVPAHTADEQKALDEYKTLTPEQQIARIEKGPMPAAAKQAMIKKIKDQNGLK